MISYQAIKEKLEKYNRYPGYLIVFANLAFVLLFVVYGYKWYFHSDAATKMLLASEMIKHGTLIPPVWYYVNGDIWIFFIYLPLVLLERIFGYGWTAYVANTLVYIGFYLAAVLFFLKRFSVDFYSKVLLFVLAFSAYSTVNAMMVFGELTGISEPIFIFALLGILLSMEKHQSKKSYWLMGILIFVYTVGGPSRSLVNNVAPVLLVTFLLMASLFESFLYPLVILFSVPLAGLGGLGALALVNAWIAPQPMDVLTMLGFVILLGTVVNNAILIVHQSLNNVRYLAMEPMEAISSSVRTRIRPIFMSATTSVLAMIPLVVSTGSGSELYRGLGSILLGGLTVSTMFTLFVIPALLTFVIRFERSRKDEAA